MRKDAFTKKLRLIIAFAIFCLFIGVWSPNVGNAQDTRVFDNASLFSTSEAEQLESSVSALREKMNMDVAIVTTDDAEGKTPREFADDYYDEMGLGMGNGESGVLFLIDMDNREIYIATAGKMITYLTDDRIESILDMAYEGVSAGDYYDSAASFLSGVEQYFDDGIVGNQYQYDEETGEITRYRSLEVYEVMIAIAVSLGVGGAFYGIVAHRYSGRSGLYKFPVRQNSKVRLTNQQDTFINRTITKVPIRTDRGPGGGGGSGGGRSTVHRSGGGGMRGGGGRGF